MKKKLTIEVFEDDKGFDVTTSGNADPKVIATILVSVAADLLKKQVGLKNES